MKQIVIGALAHVDAGKTTLAESILFLTGITRNKGRVDNKDTFLDFNQIEKEKGITVFSKQAHFSNKEKEFVYLDTPGHNELAYETNRALKVLDAAILIVSAIENIQTDTIKKFLDLNNYNIPIYIFVNKMDIAVKDKEEIIKQLQDKLSDDCIEYKNVNEHLAYLNEAYLEEYIGTNTISNDKVIDGLTKHFAYPVFFGSALKDIGIQEMLDYISLYTNPIYDATKPLNAYIYKIDNEYTYLKILEGTLVNKSVINNEKINGIYEVNGDSYSLVQSAEASNIVAVKGLNQKIGTYLPSLKNDYENKMPSLTYCLNTRLDVNEMYRKLITINNEFPELNIELDNNHIYINLNGDLHKLIIQKMIKEKTNEDVSFSDSVIKLKETIKEVVFGVGHYEPLRHYAEVVVRLSPYDNGLKINSLIHNSYISSLLNNLNAYHPRGIVTNSELTNIEITIVDIKTHLKHTEGGDLVQALSRAIRQGLSKIESTILEPYYLVSFNIQNNETNDIISYLSLKNISYVIEEDNVIAKIAQREVNDIITNLNSKLKGNLAYSIDSVLYDELKDSTILESNTYDYRQDYHRPAGSVFTKAGAGHYVEPEDVESMMHLNMADYTDKVVTHTVHNKSTINDEELKRVWNNLYKPKERHFYTSKTKEEENKNRVINTKELVYLIDGYNLMYFLDEELAEKSFQVARDKVIDLVCDYSGYVAANCILVFDAYKNEYASSMIDEHDNITIVYTKRNETADTYIENKSKELGKLYKVIVVTSDRLEQFGAFSKDASIISSREFLLRYENIKKNNTYENKKINNRPLEELRKLLVED